MEIHAIACRVSTMASVSTKRQLSNAYASLVSTAHIAKLVCICSTNLFIYA